MNKELKYKKIINEWGSFSMIIGISHIMSTNSKAIKLLWAVFFLVCLGFCIYQIMDTIVTYSKYETTPKIDVVREASVPFPAITICSVKSYKEYTFKMEKLDDTYLTSGNRNYTPLNALGKKMFFIKYIIANEIIRNELNPDDVGLSLEKEMLFSCYFNGRPCNASYFTKFWSDEYGNCYTFNDGKKYPILTITQNGNEHGLHLELIVGKTYIDESYNTVHRLFINFVFNNVVLEDRIDWISENYKSESGLFINVHNQSVPPFSLINGIVLPAGYEIYLPIKRTFQNKLSNPYSNCISDLEEFKNSKHSETVYNLMANVYNMTEYNEDICYNICYQGILKNFNNIFNMIKHSTFAFFY